MKNLFVVLVTTLLMSFAAQANNHHCRVELEPAGIWRTYCPHGALVNATSTTVRRVGNSHFTDTNVRCVRPRVVCSENYTDFQEDREIAPNNFLHH